jgi:hypothetical protein
MEGDMFDRIQDAKKLKLLREASIKLNQENGVLIREVKDLMIENKDLKIRVEILEGKLEKAEKAYAEIEYVYLQSRGMK